MPQPTILSIPFQLKRLYAASSDPDSVFSTTADRAAYLTATNNKYPGQIVYDAQLDQLFRINSALDAYVSLSLDFTFTSDIVVSLSGGKTLGRFVNGSTIPSTGKTAREVIEMLAVEEIYPTYSQPSGQVTASPGIGTMEVGTAFSTTVDIAYTQGDAGAVSNKKIKNGATVLGNAPYSFSSTAILGNITLTGTYDYAAGAIKYSTPSHLPAPGNILAGSGNANGINFTGNYKTFFGATDTTITAGNLRTALVNNLFFTNAVTDFATGTVAKNFYIAVPPTHTLNTFIDSTSSGAPLLPATTNSSITIADGGSGTLVYTLYKLTTGAPYGDGGNLFKFSLV